MFCILFFHMGSESALGSSDPVHDSADNHVEESTADSCVWYQYYDDTHQSYYYISSITGISQWEQPDTGVIKWGYDDYCSGEGSYAADEERADEETVTNGTEEIKVEDSSPLKEGRSTCDIQRTREEKTLVGGKNVDYLHLARQYKLQRPYRDPYNKVLCVLCRNNFAEDVFFPCQHRCVCRKCIRNEQICEDRMLVKMPDGYCNCSLCAAVIKLILPSEQGKEVERYWQWVYEEPVHLPIGFMRNFRHSAGVIQTVYVNSNKGEEDPHDGSNMCTLH